LKKTYKKSLKSIEKIKIEILEDFGLSNILPSYNKSNDDIFLSFGIHESRLDLDVIGLYNDCLKYLYQFEFTSFTQSIYTFYSNENISDVMYYEYLLNHLFTLESKYLQNLDETLQYKYKNVRSKLLTYYDEIKFINPRLTLLHGDLYMGNILKIDNKYKLIDFEFLLVGDREFELSFLIIWDFFSNQNIVRHSKFIIDRDIELLLSHNIINIAQKYLIYNFYFRLLFLFTCLMSAAKKYKFNDVIIQNLGVIKW